VEPLLQDLEAVGARATFFCVGRVFRSHPELARRLVAGGHELGHPESPQGHGLKSGPNQIR